jgi:predicted ribosome quality control (RQC) complex YloA/Tae2 family protein
MALKTNSITSIDIHYAVQELQELAGSRVAQILASQEGLVLSLTGKSERKQHLCVNIPGNVCITPVKESAPEHASGNTMILRKYFEGAILREVSQIGFDRVIRFRAGGSHITNLIIELFSNGNWIITDDSDMIVHAYREEHWKDRTIRAGLKYAPPKPAPNILKLDVQSLYNLIKLPGRDTLVKALAIGVGLGGIYAEEVCTRATVAKDLPINEVSEKDVFLVLNALQGLLNQTPKAYCYQTIISPVALLSCREELLDEKPSFLRARGTLQPRRMTPMEEEIIRVESAMLAQREQLDKLNAEQRAFTLLGDFIYQHYTSIQQILSILRDKNQPLDEWKKAFSEDMLRGVFDRSSATLTLTIPRMSLEDSHE